MDCGKGWAELPVGLAECESLRPRSGSGYFGPVRFMSVERDCSCKPRLVWLLIVKITVNIAMVLGSSGIYIKSTTKLDFDF